MASEHFINAPDSFYEYLCMLLSKCLLHGYMPAAVVLSTLIHIANAPFTPAGRQATTSPITTDR